MLDAVDRPILRFSDIGGMTDTLIVFKRILRLLTNYYLTFALLDLEATHRKTVNISSNI